MNTRRVRGRFTFCSAVVAAVSLIGVAASSVRADDPQLADFFGFGDLEIVKIGNGAGPFAAADMDGDGLTDLIAVNNFASRIEIHFQKKNASPDDEPTGNVRVNEFPEHWRYRRQNISVTHRVAAVIAHDFDNDGNMDLIYSGTPPEVVFVRQSSPGAFGITRKQIVKDIMPTRSAFTVADVLGDAKPELLALVKGEINVWPMDRDNLGQPVQLSAGAPMVAFIVDDFNGDGRKDVAGIIPEDAAPVRMWLGSTENNKGALGAEVRFEMPAIREFEPIHLPNEKAAAIAVIERASKRLALYDVDQEEISQTGNRDAAMEVHSFTDAGNRKRDIAVVDADGDGLLDLVTTDTQANTLVLYKQAKDKGMTAGESFPGLSEMTYIAARNVDGDPFAELFVMSEKEGVVGRSDLDAGGVPFPQPISIPDGNTPVAMNLVQLEHGPHVAVVAKSGRDYVLYLIDMKNERQSIPLGSQSRSPDTILAIDADQNGLTDLLLLTRDKPMTMLQADPKVENAGFKLMESKDMGQFGLVQAANADNTTVYDMDGDGKLDLLIADKNYVRAVRYVTTPGAGAGASAGWQVVNQINVKDPTSKLVSIAILGDRIAAADKENSRMVLMSRADDPTATKPVTADNEKPAETIGGKPVWLEAESLNVKGFSFDTIHAGAFGGDGKETILAIGSDGFAVIHLGGTRVSLKEFAAWRTTEERRLQHELIAGDVNSDGYTDLVSLDAGEQMCEVLTFSEARKLLYVTGFKVFESKLFSGGEPREFEPSDVQIADVTGDGAADLVLLSHDRLLIYPQMKKK